MRTELSPEHYGKMRGSARDYRLWYTVDINLVQAEDVLMHERRQLYGCMGGFSFTGYSMRVHVV